MLPVRHSSPRRKDDQLPKVAPQESAADDQYEVVILADSNCWKRDLDLLWEVLEVELLRNGAHEAASRITSTTDTTISPSGTEYAVVKSTRRWSNRYSGNPSPVNYLQTYVDIGVSDSFGTSPSSRHSQRQRLIHHFTTVLAPALLPIAIGLAENPLRTTYTREALADPAFGEALLFLASAHMDSLQGKSYNIETFRHRGEAIRLVNRSLDSTQQAVADSTIGAVGTMVFFEVSTVRRALKASICIGALLMCTDEKKLMNGNFEELKIHLDALEKMVRMRGGYKALGMSGVLHMVASW
ncbi:MAG: hypothetical protein LQ347_004909 [Umbilicaria vellea]|nr:MAG: hypothetical protein LQ347_004909 [Umbilicaria vellea]